MYTEHIVVLTGGHEEEGRQGPCPHRAIERQLSVSTMELLVWIADYNFPKTTDELRGKLKRMFAR